MCSPVVVCVLIPRFALLAALADRRALLADPVALAPEAGREQMVGEVSPPAEAFGVVAGMRLGEALSRCPELRLVPPDPEAVRGLWHEVLDRIERIGGEPESEHAGAAFFEADGLRGIHGGDIEGVLAATRRSLSDIQRARLGVAPSRFSSYCAAREARPRRAPVVVAQREAAGFLSRLPTALLRSRPELGSLPEMLDRLGEALFSEIDAAEVLHEDLSQELVAVNGEARLRLPIPFSGKDEISLRKIGLEVVVRAGPHKRTIVLPRAMADYRPRGASFEDGTLEVLFERGDDGRA